MAKRGRTTTFHGAFGSKEKARRKERTVPGAFIEKVTIRGKSRWLVRTQNKSK